MTRDPLDGLLRRVIARTTDGRLAGDTIAVADRLLSEPPAAWPSDVPYLDLVDFAVPTVLLSLLDVLSRRNPGSVRECSAGTDRAAWFTRALEGRYGRQALLLSVSIATRSGDQSAPAELRRPAAGVIDMEPDLLTCYARAIFGGSGTQPAGEMARYEIEAVSGRSLPHPIGHEGLSSAREAAGQRLCGQARVSGSLGTVLWHMIVWEIAAERDPADCAMRLRRWWGPPPELGERHFDGSGPVRVTFPGGGDQAARRRCRDLLESRIRDFRLTAARRTAEERARSPVRPQAGAADGTTGDASPAPDEPRLRLADGEADRTPYAAGAAIFAPWAYRKSKQPAIGMVEPADFPGRTQYPGLDDPVAMIKVLAGAALAVRILRAQRADNAPQYHLLSLMMHGKDVLSDCRFKPIRAVSDNGLEPDPALVPVTSVPRSLYGLVIHVDRMLDQAGKGSFEQIAPETLARFLLQRAFGQRTAGQRELTAQERNLHWHAAPAITVQWIKEVLSGYGNRDDDAAGGRWFARAEPGSRRLSGSLPRASSVTVAKRRARRRPCCSRWPRTGSPTSSAASPAGTGTRAGRTSRRGSSATCVNTIPSAPCWA